MKHAQIEGYINKVEEHEIIEALDVIENDPKFLSKPTIKSGEPVPFVAFHIGFLRSHPQLNPHHYVSNLRLILRK